MQECTVVAPDMVLPEAAAAADGNLHFFLAVFGRCREACLFRSMFLIRGRNELVNVFYNPKRTRAAQTSVMTDSADV